MKKLNILFVSERFWPSNAPGATWSFGLMRELCARGNEVTVLTSLESGMSRAEDLTNMRILRIDNFNDSCQSILLSLLTKEHFDILHTFGYSASEAAIEIDRIPKLASIHRYLGNDWNTLIGKFRASKMIKREREIIERLDCKIQVPSSFTRDKILEDTEKGPSIISNWIDFNLIKGIRNEKHKKDNYVISVGSLDKLSNHEKTIKNIPHRQKLIILGAGKDKETLEKLAEEHGRNVEFIDYLTQEDTLRMIRDSKKLISNQINTSYGFNIIQALLLGTNVETAVVGIVQDILQLSDDKVTEGKVTLKPEKKMSLKGLPVLVKREAAEQFEKLYEKIIKEHNISDS